VDSPGKRMVTLDGGTFRIGASVIFCSQVFVPEFLRPLSFFFPPWNSLSLL